MRLKPGVQKRKEVIRRALTLYVVEIRTNDMQDYKEV